MCDICGPGQRLSYVTRLLQNFNGYLQVLLLHKNKTQMTQLSNENRKFTLITSHEVLFIEKPCINLTIRVCVIVYHHLYDTLFLMQATQFLRLVCFNKNLLSNYLKYSKLQYHEKPSCSKRCFKLETQRKGLLGPS